MRHFLSYALLGSLIVTLTSCTTFEPPPRPVAYVFPTIRDMASLDDVEERDVTVKDIHGWLARAGIYNELRAGGITDDDWMLLARGLRRGGYAELDLRKTRIGFRWVTISCLKGGTVEVMIGYDRDRGKAMRAGMVWQPRVLDETVRRCSMPNMAISDAWFGRTGTTEREYVVLNSKATGKPAFWLKRLVFDETQEEN